MSEDHVSSDKHGGEPWWIVVAKFGRDDYASATVDAPDEETAAAQGERVIVANEGREPGKIHNTRGPFPRHVPTEEREIRPKMCGGCGLKRYCGNHPPMPPQTWWTLYDEVEGRRGWECIQCGTRTWMAKVEEGPADA